MKIKAVRKYRFFFAFFFAKVLPEKKCRFIFVSNKNKKYYIMTNSIVKSVLTPTDKFSSTTKLVFANLDNQIMDSIMYDFSTLSLMNIVYIDVKKGDLIKMMWKFRMTRSQIVAQLKNQFTGYNVSLLTTD